MLHLGHFLDYSTVQPSSTFISSFFLFLPLTKHNKHNNFFKVLRKKSSELLILPCKLQTINYEMKLCKINSPRHSTLAMLIAGSKKAAAWWAAIT